MKKFICMAIAMLFVASCGTSKKVSETQGMDYSAEEVELVGVGRGEDSNWNVAHGVAVTAALGDLNMKMEDDVRTAISDYTKKTSVNTKVLYESLTEVVARNKLYGVKFTGDLKEYSYRNGKYEFRVKAYLNHTYYRKNVESILDELDATDEERDEFRRKMFGDSL